MYSRAHLLIERDLDDLMNRNPIEGILVFPLFEDNLFDIVAKIEGLPNTIWESGVFQIFLKFNEFYNDAPPIVSFQTIPFHPNIDVSTGKPSVDFLDDFNKWKTDYTIRHILQSLQQLLAYPLLDRAVNMDAVFMLKGNPDRYAKIARESVIASQRIQKGLAPFPGINYSKNTFSKYNTRDTQSSNTFASGVGGGNNAATNLTSNNNTSAPGTPLYSTQTVSISATLPITVLDAMKSTSNVTERDAGLSDNNPPITKTKRVSFEDYYRLWKGIATSKPDENAENIYIEYDLNQNPAQMAQHLGLTLKDLEMQMMQQLNEHKNIMYGRFSFKQNDKLDETFQKEVENNNEIKSVSAKSNIKSGSNLTGNKNLDRINRMKNIYLNRTKEPTIESDGRDELQNNYMSSLPSSRKSNKTDSNLFKPKSAISTIQNNNSLNWENEVDDLVNWTQGLNEQIM